VDNHDDKLDLDSMAEPTSTAALHQKLNDNNTNTSTDESDELEAKLADAEEKVSLYHDKYLRLQAEMENMKRRLERDVTNAHKYALEKFVLELLPIIDSMERSLVLSAESTGDQSAILEGVMLIMKMFSSALEKFGVEQIDPTGAPFDPELHQAVSIQVDPEVKSNHVINVLQKGYLLNKRLIRPAMVVVCKA
jgi:molecular chaperone GrpE